VSGEDTGARGRRLAAVVAADAAEIRTLRLADGDAVLVNPNLPVVILGGAFEVGAGADAVRARLEGNGWGGAWTWRVFPYHHHHPNAHEALAVASGRAELMLGGPGGERVRVAAGDVLVLPAGTGHRQMEGSADFQVCGAYPPGQERYETIRGDGPHDGETLKRIRAVPLPDADPAFGPDGPLPKLWSS
jgi:uncharacterized protein YjlB